MKPIYKPKDRAGEYAEYAINIYTGCSNGCTYCYAPRVLRKSREDFERNVNIRGGSMLELIEALEKQLASGAYEGKTIHLCFTCDPYPAKVIHDPTTEVIGALKNAGCHVQILTKNPTASMRDWGLLDGDDWIGSTFSGADPWYAGYPNDEPYLLMEPWAENEAARYKALKAAKAAGLRTWASCEPVIQAKQIYHLIALDGEDNPIDLFKIGKLNHVKNYTDWAAFGNRAEALCKKHGRNYVIKKDLRSEMERGV